VRLVCGADGRAKGCEIERLESIFRGIRARFPAIWLEGLRSTDVLANARSCGLGVGETIARLRDAGLDSIAGDAAVADGPGHEIEEWLEVHRASHRLGMRTTATMVFAAGGFEERVDFLEAVRRVQEETGGFAAFLPLCLQSGDTSHGALEGPTAVEYLKTLAIARMFLDSVENLQASGATQGLKLLQMGLRFGANDGGLVVLEVMRGKTASGTRSQATEEGLRRVIRDAGFTPALRDAAYRTMFLN